MKTNTNYNGQEHHVLKCMYLDFKDLTDTHLGVIKKGRSTPEIDLLETRIIDLEESFDHDEINDLRESHLPKEKQLSFNDQLALSDLKTKYPHLFKEVPMQNIKEFFLELINKKTTPERKVIEKQLSMQDHFDLEQMMRLKEEEIN